MDYEYRTVLFLDSRLEVIGRCRQLLNTKDKVFNSEIVDAGVDIGAYYYIILRKNKIWFYNYIHMLPINEDNRVTDHIKNNIDKYEEYFYE